MAFSWVTPVRGVQALVALIVLGLSGYMVSQDPPFDSPAYTVFVSVWTLLICAFFLVTGLAMPDSFLSNPLISVGLDFLSFVFWLASFAALAAKLHYFDGLPDEVAGSNFPGTLRAGVAFGVIEWLLFTATLVWNGLSGFRGKSTGGGAPAHQGV